MLQCSSQLRRERDQNVTVTSAASIFPYPLDHDIPLVKVRKCVEIKTFLKRKSGRSWVRLARCRPYCNAVYYVMLYYTVPLLVNGDKFTCPVQYATTVEVQQIGKVLH